jgi:PAT family beta-lactamase induction signal transducer AmpG
MKKSFRLALFSSLYFAQGMLMSYFLTFNILFLGESGYSAGEVGIFQAVLVLPFVLKIFLGMLSDGVNLFGLGHRKPYIALGLGGQIVMMLLAPQISVENNLTAFALVALAASISMALYDTCTDGLALDTTPHDERGTIQGAMVGARALGILVMLVVGGRIAEQLGWPWVFYSISAITLLPLSLLLFSGLKEKEIERGQRQEFKWAAFKYFSSGVVILLAIMGLTYSIALDGVVTFLSDHLRVIFDVSIGDIGLLVAISMVGRILGALTNSWVTDRIGRKQSLMVAIGLASVGCFGLAFDFGLYWIGFFGFLFGLAYGYYSAVYAAVAMDVSDPRISASMFAIFMMFINLGTVGGQVLGGQIIDNFSFATMVIVFGVLNLVNVPLVIGIAKKIAAAETA